MRLAAQMKGGFYPAPEAAISLATTFLRPPKDQPFSILDPCAGEGDAIRQLGKLLDCPESSTYAIELDDSRAERLHTALPEAPVLAPASIFGCRASLNSFSFIWLNPPFDSSYGGHRVEHRFLLTATDWLMPGGVMALVCPEDVIGEFSDARDHFASCYENCQVVPFPESCRQFKEVIVFGHKRTRRHANPVDEPEWESIQAPPGFVYDIPSGHGPRVFKKVEPTESELQNMLAKSPLRSHLTTAAELPVPSPPLALGIGHVALLLASGHLDGVVQPAGRSPHVVRGISRKREFVAAVTDVENDDGSTTKKTTISERIELVVRTVDLTGNIQTFMDTDSQEPALAPAA
jgi:hypothetical protein